MSDQIILNVVVEIPSVEVIVPADLTAAAYANSVADAAQAAAIAAAAADATTKANAAQAAAISAAASDATTKANTKLAKSQNLADLADLPTALQNLGFAIYASLDEANAGIAAIGVVFYNSTTNRYEVTSSAS